MRLTMQEKSRYQAGPFPLPESRTERKISHPGRIHQHYRVQKPEVRHAPSQHADADASPPLYARRGGQTQTRQPQGQKIYTDEVTATPRLVRAFFWYKCGKLPAPLMRQQMDSPAFGITPVIGEKLMSISPATIGRALRGKSLTKSAALLKHRIPIRTFYTPEERKLLDFIQIDTVLHCGQATSGQYILTLTATGVTSGRICRYSLLNKAHCRTFDALRDVCAGLPSPLGSSTAITVAGLSTMPSPAGTATPPTHTH
jgi:hypothetical protein